jgi:hypothetical protein
MRLAQIALALTAILILTACSNSNEDLPTDAPTATSTPWPTIGQNTSSISSSVLVQISHCPSGVAATPTPSAFAPCSSQSSDSAPIVGDLPPSTADPPATPPFRAVSDYFSFGEMSGLGPVTMNAPLKYVVPPGYKLAFYEYSTDDWIHLQSAESDGYTATAVFDTLPANLIVLAEPE